MGNDCFEVIAINLSSFPAILSVNEVISGTLNMIIAYHFIEMLKYKPAWVLVS